MLTSIIFKKKKINHTYILEKTIILSSSLFVTYKIYKIRYKILLWRLIRLFFTLKNANPHTARTSSSALRAHHTFGVHTHHVCTYIRPHHRCTSPSACADFACVRARALTTTPSPVNSRSSGRAGDRSTACAHRTHCPFTLAVYFIVTVTIYSRRGHSVRICVCIVYIKGRKSRFLSRRLLPGAVIYTTRTAL